MALSAAACGPTLGVRARLVARVQAFSGCRGPYNVLQLSDDAFEVRGCGRSVELTDVRPGNGRDFQLMSPAAARAREEMGCEYDSLVRTGTAGPTERRFEGCGASATYHLFCAELGCHWERYGDIVRTASVAPAEPAPAGSVPADMEPADMGSVPLDVVVPPPPGAPETGAP